MAKRTGWDAEEESDYSFERAPFPNILEIAGYIAELPFRATSYIKRTIIKAPEEIDRWISELEEDKLD